MIKNIKTVSKAKHLTEKITMACSAKEQFVLYPHHSLSTIHHHYPAPPTSVLSGARDLKSYLIEDFLFWMKKKSLTVVNFSFFSVIIYIVIYN